jgi:hypothetical protein
MDRKTDGWTDGRTDKIRSKTERNGDTCNKRRHLQQTETLATNVSSNYKQTPAATYKECATVRSKEPPWKQQTEAIWTKPQNYGVKWLSRAADSVILNESSPLVGKLVQYHQQQRQSLLHAVLLHRFKLCGLRTFRGLHRWSVCGSINSLYHRAL